MDTPPCGRSAFPGRGTPVPTGRNRCPVPKNMVQKLNKPTQSRGQVMLTIRRLLQPPRLKQQG